MPEGHTLHRLADALTQSFAGRPVSVSSPQGRFAAAAAELDGHVFGDAEAWGKHLFLHFRPETAGSAPAGGTDADPDADRIVQVHLGLIGTFVFGPPGPPVGQVRLRVATEAVVADLRGPQICALITPAELAAVVARLGPDPLRPDADPERAWSRIHRSGKPVGALLMDQEVLAGVGNVYRAEVLFRNRIDPHRVGRRLSRARFDEIWADLIKLMPEGVRTGRIDTVRPEHTPEAMGRPPRVDDHGGEVYVYRRAGQPCFVCGSRVRTEVLEGRNLFWCGRCQRRG